MNTENTNSLHQAAPRTERATVSTPEDHLTLKWGSLKSWALHSARGANLLKQYFAIGSNESAILRHDNTEQKELICQMIDECNAPTIYLDWDGKDVSKEEAKDYVRGYGLPKEQA